jgi:hypothetical protein
MTTTNTDTTPKGWLGCLACYNSGRLRGTWLDLDELAEPAHFAPDYFVSLVYPSGYTYTACKLCGGDELALLDTENLPRSVGESWGDALAYAEALDSLDLDEHREAFGAYLDYHYTADYAGALDHFHDSFVASFDYECDCLDFIEDTAHDLLELDGLHESIRDLLDRDKLRDPSRFDMSTTNYGGRVYLWRDC